MTKQGVEYDTLRQYAYEHYLACLYIPEPYRSEIATLWAFDAEIRRIPLLVSEPMPGEIRLQWWRDLINSGNNAGSGPFAGELMELIKTRELPRETFDSYLDARIFDLYHDPMPDTGTLEGYLGETVSCFFLMSALVYGAEPGPLLSDACGHAGMALGISRMLTTCSRDRRQDRVYFPADIISKHDLDRELWLSPNFTEDHARVIREMCSLAQYHLTFARSVMKQLPEELMPLFLPVSMVEPVLNRVKKSPLDILNQPAGLSRLKSQWILMRAAMRKIP